MLIRQMNISDYDEVIELWRHSEYISLHETQSDSKEGIKKSLDRNPGLSFVAEHNGDLVAALLCGHDGRNGSLHHLAVKKDFRKQKIGRKLVERCAAALKSSGINRIILHIYRENEYGLKFWDQLGFQDAGHIVTVMYKQF